MGRNLSSDPGASGPPETLAPPKSRGRGRGLGLPAQPQQPGGPPRPPGPGAPRRFEGQQDGGMPRQMRPPMRPPQGPHFDHRQGPPQERRMGPGQQGGMRGPRPYGQQQMGRPGQQQREPWPPAASGRFEDADDDPLAPSMGPRNRGRRQSLMKKPLRDGEPEEDGQERAVAMRSRGPARGVSMAGQDGGELARRSARRQVPQDWGGLTEMEEQYESGGGRQGEGMWKTGVNQLEERETRDAIARFVEEEQRLAGDSLRPGPWMMPEADPPGFYPVPAEIMKDRERMAKLELLDPALDINIGGPPPPRVPAPKLSSAEVLERLKPDLMRTLGIEPDDEEAWTAAVEGIADEVDSLGIQSTPDTWAEMEELEALAQELLPEDHAMRAHLDRSMRMLQANPSWPHEAKCAYMRRLVRGLTGPLPKRLQARAAALGF
ncbi:hypothetical protein WJX75_001618 [Coccomyxa subellipsoidea]|uniref:Uncharacterized protein n=1 Tax=Coccomyxa subellipsoidea TaxID=248742 RepID=A0ABR2YJY8_9CHLO